MRTLLDQSQHLDRVLPGRRRIQYVKIRKTAQRGRAWNIWDFEFTNTTAIGPEPWMGFRTKAEAVRWIQQQNATDIMLKMVIVKD